MSLLEQLSLSNTAAPKPDRSPTGRFRSKIIEAIDLQIAMAEAQTAGTEIRPTRTRAFRNNAGERERREVAIRLRPWWWTDEAGTTFLSIRHGGRVVEIAHGKTAIEVGAFSDLTATLAILRDAARAGELDGCREEMTRTMPRKADKEAEGQGPPAVPRKASRKAEAASSASSG